MATLSQVVSDIKSLKIQGAQTIAVEALKAYAGAKDKKLAAKLLKNARPTEPMLFNAIDAVERGADSQKLIEKFQADRKKIAELGAKLIKNNSVIFTHCHSSTVVEILKEAKRQGKTFEVHNTETRPMFQGRITASELAKAGIKVRHYVDSAVLEAMKRANLVLIGADWISKKGIVNKIGTGAFSEMTFSRKIPVYCCSHSWKFSGKELEVEQRPAKEVWLNSPRGVHVENPAFEMADKKFIKGIISEKGILSFKDFVDGEVKRHGRI